MPIKWHIGKGIGMETTDSKNVFFSEASLPEAEIKKKVKGHILFSRLNFLLTCRKT